LGIHREVSRNLAVFFVYQLRHQVDGPLLGRFRPQVLYRIAVERREVGPRKRLVVVGTRSRRVEFLLDAVDVVLIVGSRQFLVEFGVSVNALRAVNAGILFGLKFRLDHSRLGGTLEHAFVQVDGGSDLWLIFKVTIIRMVVNFVSIHRNRICKFRFVRNYSRGC